MIDVCCPACEHAADAAPGQLGELQPREPIAEAASVELVVDGVGAFPVTGRLLVGRTGDVALASTVLSRRQFVLERAGDQVTLTDLGSSCGTWVNDCQSTPRQPVGAQDVIRAGEYTFRVRVTG